MTEKPIDGVVSDVGDPKPFPPDRYRIRFKLNGAWASRYRATKEAAESLATELRQREQANKAKLDLAPTWMPPSMVRQAELAANILKNAGLLVIGDEESYAQIAVAAEKWAKAAALDLAPITLGDALKHFLAKQRQRRLSEMTLLDYQKYVEGLGRSLADEKWEAVPLREISPKQCHNYIHELPETPTNSTRFRAYGYLAAFFAYCCGKYNQHVKPGQKTWLKDSPLNFERPPMKVNNIVSYTLDEVVHLLNEARRRKCLGYVVWRLFSLARYDETRRFIAKAGSNFKDNRFIDLKNAVIHFDADVYKKRSKGENRGRWITIHPTFRKWIEYFIERDIWFAYDAANEQMARKAAVPQKYGGEFDNLLRHTALTMHLKAFGDIMDTAVQGGTSPQIVQDHYYNQRITKDEALAFYELTPEKLGFASTPEPDTHAEIIAEVKKWATAYAKKRPQEPTWTGTATMLLEAMGKDTSAHGWTCRVGDALVIATKEGWIEKRQFGPSNDRRKGYRITFAALKSPNQRAA